MAEITVFTNATLATLQDGDNPYSLLKNGAFVVSDRRIAWVGPTDDLPMQFFNVSAVDLQGRLVTPGLIDAHTHAIFAGNRASEFEMRLNGADYETIAKASEAISN